MNEEQKKDLLLAILAMDSYNQGYDAGLEHNQRGPDKQIGTATVRDENIPAGSVAAGFYAAAYDTPYGTVISYRGTDDPDVSIGGASDIWNGWVSGAGLPAGQSKLAFDFYKSVTGTDAFDGEAQGVTLTGHSLGGGLAGRPTSA